jgi:uncharacterized protein YxeA
MSACEHKDAGHGIRHSAKKEGDLTQMKKFINIMLALALTIGVAGISVAQEKGETTSTSKKTTKKSGKKATTTSTTTSTTKTKKGGKKATDTTK